MFVLDVACKNKRHHRLYIIHGSSWSIWECLQQLSQENTWCDEMIVLSYQTLLNYNYITLQRQRVNDRDFKFQYFSLFWSPHAPYVQAGFVTSLSRVRSFITRFSSISTVLHRHFRCVDSYQCFFHTISRRLGIPQKPLLFPRQAAAPWRAAGKSSQSLECQRKPITECWKI